MIRKPVEELAQELGLTVEMLELKDHADAVRVYKGANQIFIGTEAAVDEFLAGYAKERPEPPMPTPRGYKE